MLYTIWSIFTESEYLFNSRPYVFESNSPQDLSSLSPNDIPKYLKLDPVGNFHGDLVRRCKC